MLSCKFVVLVERLCFAHNLERLLGSEVDFASKGTGLESGEQQYCVFNSTYVAIIFSEIVSKIRQSVNKSV